MKTIVPRASLLILPASLALATAGCGGDDAGGGGSDGPSVQIMQPADGASLSVPFTLKVESSEELGTTESGLHHIHLYFDGNDDTYEVLEDPADEEIEIDADSPALEGIEPGEHTLEVSLRNADHSAAGAEDEVEVTIEGSGETTSSTSDDTGSDDTGSDDTGSEDSGGGDSGGGSDTPSYDYDY
jgi:hypothetical protein